MLNDTPKDRVRKITKGILAKISKQKRNMNAREVSNEEVALVMAQYSITHLSTISDEDRDRLDEMLTRLDQQLFDIVSLYFWGGKTLEQIAETYGKSHTWVGNKLTEAYEVMRRVK